MAYVFQASRAVACCMAGGEIVGRLPAPDRPPVDVAAVSDDGRRVVVVSSDMVPGVEYPLPQPETVTLFDVATGQVSPPRR